MADEEAESLREFASFIQQKTEQPEADRQQPAGVNEPDTSRREALQAKVDRRSGVVVTGIAAGIGVAIGFLIGKLKR